jgi:glucosamine-6-phosphate deaminase
MYRQTSIVGDPVIFLLDEFGGLGRDDPARCAGMLARDLPGVSFLVPEVDSADPVAAAERYRNAIAGDGLDLAVVGLGENGHVGMNEPGSSRDSTTRVVELAESTQTGALAYGAEHRPEWGITVGISELVECHEVWVVVTGSHKSAIFARVMRSGVGPDLPATYLREHPNVRFLADTAAARLL